MSDILIYRKQFSLAQKCGRQRAKRDLAALQEHEARKESAALQSADTPTKVSSGDLQVI